MLKRTITGLSMAAVMIYALLTSITTALLLLSVILVFSAVEWNRHFNLSAPKLKGPYFFITIILLCAVLGFVLFNNPTLPIHRLYGILPDGARQPIGLPGKRRAFYAGTTESHPRSHYLAGLYRVHLGLFQKRNPEVESFCGIWIFGVGGLFY